MHCCALDILGDCCIWCPLAEETGYDNVQEEEVFKNTCLPTCESQAENKI